MLPLVAGIMAGAGSSGVAISRTGRYRVFPLLGTVLMTVGLVSLSSVVGTGTPYGLLLPFMAIFGVGVGFTFQPVVVAVQNAVSPREIGVATSSVAFFRQTGATVGAAAFLSLLFARLPGEVDRAVQDAVRTDPGLAPRLQRLDGVGSDLSDSSFVQQLPDAVAQPFQIGRASRRDRA